MAAGREALGCLMTSASPGCLLPPLTAIPLVVQQDLGFLLLVLAFTLLLPCRRAEKIHKEL